MSIPAELNVVEDDETVRVCAMLIIPFITEFDITVNLATSDDTGTYVCILVLSVTLIPTRIIL